jgi:murein DD-endopeptidase MepM/ murein hydrolase activator NlpD
MKIYTKYHLIVFALYLFNTVSAQQNATVFSENKSNGATLYAVNKGFCPSTVILEFNLSNMVFTKGAQTIFVIPAGTEKMLLGDIGPDDPKKRFSFSYKYRSVIGDATLKGYDTAYVYDLPFAKGQKFKLTQGYNGSQTHQHQNALDFTMAEHNLVVAARDGVVMKVVDNNNESCPNETCQKFNNVITIYHSDGTFADYAHIQYNGSKVRPGDKVQKGQVIAYSGNTGWSSGPHLHFAVFFLKNNHPESLETRFKIGDGSQIVYLKEKDIYSKDY